MAKALCALLLTVLLGGLCGGALAADPQTELDRTKNKLGEVRERKGVLTGELRRMGTTIEVLRRQTREVRARERETGAALVAKQGELDRARQGLGRAIDHLGVTKGRLRRALKAMRDRVVAMYETGTPDLASIVLAGHDLDEAASVSEYLERIRLADEALVGRVRELRDDARATVTRRARLRDRIAAARDAIRVRRAALQATRIRGEAKESSLGAAIAERRSSLDSLKGREKVLEGDVSELQTQIAAALEAAASTAGAAPPIQPGAATGTFAWPVDGTLTSGFGYRWGRQHEGIDVGAAEGTPIWAAAAGTVVLQQGESESGGYGNYTCIEHPGVGLTTCYAHQSAFEVSLGEKVSQGQVIGLVGNTGNSFGAHLHFEVRSGGGAQDPLAYL
ncbi:MAG: peptidoglycan DD-metalloendopeptidase family protein [Actinobacteria bacterium]|nr:peptidoglycan DD-metalloendopeptidase family protein [Actinomycetota bacterium]OJU86139.1 MAG: hypothetical protein BGO11_01035 [Solirubrobacterales bacterium 70-9]